MIDSSFESALSEIKTFHKQPIVIVIMIYHTYKPSNTVYVIIILTEYAEIASSP